MALGDYLTKFRSSLPTSQASQILSRLTSKRDTGEIRTVDEFKRNLRELTSTLLQEQIKPSFQLLEGIIGEDISPKKWNEMVSRIQDDLETAFTEADTIEEVLTAHHNIVQEVALKTIRYGLNELESRISFYEYIARTTYGFDDALFNTFREAKNISTPRSAEGAGSFYLDFRNLNETITQAEDAYVDLNGERLVLGQQTQTYITPADVEWLSNPYSTHGEIEVILENSNIKNIIDGQSNTYWLVPILFSTPRPEGAYIEVSIKLPTTQDMNFIELDPVSSYAMTLAQIDYIGPNNIRETAYTTETSLNRPVQIYFGRITARYIILRVRQDSYNEIQFKTGLTSTKNFYKALAGKKTKTIDITDISKSLQRILTSDFLLTDILQTDTSTGDMERYYQYLFGFDNIRPGFATYDDRSIFVSKVHTIDKPGQVGVKVVETRPTQVKNSNVVNQLDFTYPERTSTEDNKFYHGSIEYWLTFYLYTSEGSQVVVETIPLLPVGAKRIYHERLLLTHKSSTTIQYNDLGSFMFFTGIDTSDVLLYRNSALLPYGSSGWEFADEATYPEITFTSPNSGQRMKRGVKINVDLNPLDIYTVSYTPTLSNITGVPQVYDTLASVVDLVGDQGLRLVRNNIVAISKTHSSYLVDSAEAYLTVILRRNSAQEHLTPALEEFTLLSSSRESTKLLKDF